MITMKREKVYLSKLGKDVFVNPISIDDDEWMSENFSETQLVEAFKTVNVQVIFAIFWRILDVDSKRMISKATVVEFDGLVEKQIEVTDPIVKLKKIICGAKEIMDIMTAILNTKTNSMPDVSANQKKSPKGETSSVKQKSLTSLQASTEPTLKVSESLQENSLVI